uniref:separase n=1 Tax=Parastrongyloides trichosuri TaxID=131310 RepID=A0A0N5A5H2_PARTI
MKTQHSGESKSGETKLLALLKYANDQFREQWKNKGAIIEKIFSITKNCTEYTDSYFLFIDGVNKNVQLDLVKSCLYELSKIDIIQQIEPVYKTIKTGMYPLFMENKETLNKNTIGKCVALTRTVAAAYMLHGYYIEAADLFKMVFNMWPKDVLSASGLFRICLITNDVFLLTDFINKTGQVYFRDKDSYETNLTLRNGYRLLYLAQITTDPNKIKELQEDIIKAEIESNEHNSILSYDVQIPLLMAKAYLKYQDYNCNITEDHPLKIRSKICEKILPSIIYHYYKDFSDYNTPLCFDIDMKNDNFVGAISSTALYFEEGLSTAKMLMNSGRVKECNMKCYTLLSAAIRVGCRFRLLSVLNLLALSDSLVKSSTTIKSFFILTSEIFDIYCGKEIENTSPKLNHSMASEHDLSSEYLTPDESFDKKEYEHLVDTNFNVKYHKKSCNCQRCIIPETGTSMMFEKLYSKWIREDSDESITKQESIQRYVDSWLHLAEKHRDLWKKITGDITNKSKDSLLWLKRVVCQLCDAIMKVLVDGYDKFKSSQVRMLLKVIKTNTRFNVLEFYDIRMAHSVFSNKYSIRTYFSLPTYCYDLPLNFTKGIQSALDDIIAAEIKKVTKEFVKEDTIIASALKKTIKENKQAILDYIISFNNLRLPPADAPGYLSLRKVTNKSDNTGVKEVAKSIFNYFVKNLHIMDLISKKIVLSALLRVYDIVKMDQWEMAWIVAECTGVAIRSHLSCTTSQRYFFKSVDEFKNHVKNFFTDDSTIIQLFMDDEDVLWLMKLHKNVEPLIWPLKKLHSDYFSIIHEKFITMHDDVTKKSGKSNGRVFWAIRYDLEDSYKYICTKIQREVLGTMGFLLLPYTKLETSSLYTSFVKSLKKASYPTSVALSLASAIPFLTPSEFNNILRDMSDICLMDEEVINSLSSLFKRLATKIIRDFKTAGYLPEHFTKKITASEMVDCSKEVFTTLILDNELSKYPWEMISYFNYRPMITRMTSLMNYDLLLEKNNLSNLNTRNSYYIINPKGDLKDTENWMLQLLDNMEWEGIKGEWPKPEIVKEFTLKKDVLVYIGHGNGKQVFRVALKEQKFRSVAILMGCSSVRLGPSSKGYASLDLVENYFNSSGSGILGCTILVTDREINKYFEYIFMETFKETRRLMTYKKSVTYYMVKAREHVKLYYLTAGSVVFYGIPTLMI